jgi:cell division septum initiation protein DivIVA
MHPEQLASVIRDFRGKIEQWHLPEVEEALQAVANANELVKQAERARDAAYTDRDTAQKEAAKEREIADRIRRESEARAKDLTESTQAKCREMLDEARQDSATIRSKARDEVDRLEHSIVQKKAELSQLSGAVIEQRDKLDTLRAEYDKLAARFK